MKRLPVSVLDEDMLHCQNISSLWLLKFGNSESNLCICLRPAKFNLFDKDKLQMTCSIDQLCGRECK